MNTFKIAQIGTGGIGFRHFQSLLGLKLPTTLYVIDVSEDALRKDKQFADANNPNGLDIQYGTSVSILPESIDVAIIATSSLVRKKVFEELIAKTKVKYVLFEKFLFPKSQDYSEVKDLLDKHGIKAYVNCISRLFPGYVALKEEIDDTKQVNMFVTGSNWGLACNIIHDVDVAGFLANSYDKLTCDGSLLDNEIHTSKRANYIEFTGRFICSIGNKVNIILDSASSGEQPYLITVCNGENTYVIDEGGQKIHCFNHRGYTTKDFPIYYVSQSTEKIVKSLIETGTCGLTKYEDTCQWHIALLEEFLRKYNEFSGIDHDSCPIT